jgi:hypothetical protein
MGTIDASNKWVIPSIIGIIHLFKEAYIEPIENLSNGYVTMEDILHNLVSISETLVNQK